MASIQQSFLILNELRQSLCSSYISITIFLKPSFLPTPMKAIELTMQACSSTLVDFGTLNFKGDISLFFNGPNLDSTPTLQEE